MKRQARDHEVGDHDCYWSEMGDEARRSGEHEYLQGRVAEVIDDHIVRVRSDQTGRLWDVYLDDDGVTQECVEASEE